MIYSVKIHTKKEAFFMRVFLSCKNHEERTNIIHTMFDNGLDRLASKLIEIIKFHYLSKYK